MAPRIFGYWGGSQTTISLRGRLPLSKDSNWVARIALMKIKGTQSDTNNQDKLIFKVP